MRKRTSAHLHQGPEFINTNTRELSFPAHSKASTASLPISAHSAPCAPGKMSVTVSGRRHSIQNSPKAYLTNIIDCQKLQTTHGPLKVEVFCESVPKTAEVRISILPIALNSHFAFPSSPPVLLHPHLSTCHTKYNDLHHRTSSPSAPQDTTPPRPFTGSSPPLSSKQATAPPPQKPAPSAPANPPTRSGARPSKTRSGPRCGTMRVGS